MKKIIIFVLLLIIILITINFIPALGNKGNYKELVLDFKESISKAELKQLIKEIAAQYNVSPKLNSIYSEKDNIYIIKGNEELLDALLDSKIAKYTEYIEPNYIYNATALPNDPMYAQQWNFKSIEVEKAWAISQGKGVVVAVIDTGVKKLPDLNKTDFVPGYDFVHDRVDATDDQGHGSHVAGTIAQSTNNGVGIAGIAYKAKIMPIKVLKKFGGGTISDIAEGIRFAADNGAHIINMSLGGGAKSYMMMEAIRYAHSKGVLIIASAGNSSNDKAGYPGRYDNVIGVSATGPGGKLAPYSNYGIGVDLSAPGGNTSAGQSGGILQNTIDGKGNSVFKSLQGTSMASPHVAGVAALIRSLGVRSPKKIKRILFASADKVDNDSKNYFGAGRLNAYKAVLMASGKKAIEYSDPNKQIFNYNINTKAFSPMKSISMLGLAVALAFLFRRKYHFPWSANIIFGIVLGSCGIFILRVVQHIHFPQWFFQLGSSSLVEIGNFNASTGILNPITASFLIPFLFIIFFLGHPGIKWFAIGSAFGVSAALIVNTISFPGMMWIESDILSRVFLVFNIILTFILLKLSLKVATGVK